MRRHRLTATLARWVLSLACCLATAPSIHAQYFSEGFDDIDSIWTRGWEQRNMSNPQGSIPYWFQGDTTRFAAQSGADSSYIAVDYNSIGGVGSISNWLFMPTCTFSNGEKIEFWTRTVDPPLYPDRIQVRLSLNGSSTYVGTSAASVGDFSTVLTAINPNLTTTGYPHSWTKYTLVITGLAAPTTGRVAFRYIVGNGGPGGNNSDYIGIDSVAYFLPPAGDLELLGITASEYTHIPERQQAGGLLSARIHNYGYTMLTDAFVQVNVRNSQGSIVHTASSALVPSMAVDDHDTVTISAPTGLPVGAYTVEYIARHSSSDGDHSNDTLFDHFTITARTYARDNGDVVGSIGIGAYIGGYVGQQFTLHQIDDVDSVQVHVTKGYTGQQLAAVIWNMANGVPQQIIGTTDTLMYATDSAADYSLPMHAGPLQLAPGDYVVTMVEFDSTLHVGLGSAVFTPGTTWLRWPTLPTPSNWAHVELFNLPQYKHAQMIRLHMAATVGIDPASTPRLSLYPNPSNGRFLLDVHTTTPTDLTVTVYDATGRVLKRMQEMEVVSLKRELDLGNPAAGIYWVRVQGVDFDRSLKLVVR